MLEKYVITGGPGVGKTTLIEALRTQGYQTIPEAARAVIEEEQQKQAGIFPWKELYEFQKLVIKKQHDLEEKITQNSIAGNPTFLDRGIPDNLAYCREGNIAVPEELQNALQQVSYAGVFLLNPLPKYAQDAQRKEDAERAQKLHQLIQEAYQEQGYGIIPVPVLSVDERVRFLLGEVEKMRKRKS